MTMGTYDKILADVKSAMLSKDVLKRDCLRGIVSELKNQSVNAGKELTEDICISVLKKAAKQRNDSIQCFEAGGRKDLADNERKELELIEKYLPKMLSEQEVQSAVLSIMSSEKLPQTKASMGKIMKALNARPDSSLIDKKAAAQYLSTFLK